MKPSEILATYDTDKVNGHTYGDVYDAIFSQFDRSAELEILEIGTQKGGSLCAWQDCFPNAHVTGIDILDQVKPEYVRKDITYLVKDVVDHVSDRKYDIIIDDGSHDLGDVEYVVNNFQLKPKGVLVIEDVQDPQMWLSSLVGLLRDGHCLEKFDLRGAYDNFIIAIWNS